MNEFFKLRDVCIRITDGAHYSPAGVKEGYPMLSVKDMKQNNFEYSACRFISEKDYLDLVKGDCKPLKNDVLIAKDGSYLKHVFVTKEEREEVILSSIGILRPNLNLINPYYLKYYLHTASVKKAVAKKYVSGSALPRIILKNFGEIEIIKKSLTEQKKIASVLSALDDKIELNNQINTELEAMAKTLYSYWFVQFDFPFDLAQGPFESAQGKTNENGTVANENGTVAERSRGYKSSGGKMVFDQTLKREIPVGWGNMFIDDLGSVIGGSTPSKAKPENFCNNGTAWITPKDLSMNVGNKFISNGEYDVSSLGLKDASLNILPLNSVLMSSRAPIGYLAINRKICTTNQGFKSIVCDKDYSNEYVYYVLKNNMKTIEANASGSTFKEISGSVFKAIKIIKPDESVVTHFTEKVKPIFKKQNNLEKQNQELAQIRDWLLPMLMNGQVRVGESDGEVLGLVAEGMADYNKI